MTGVHSLLMVGAARLLDQVGAGVYRPDGDPYQTGEVAIVLGLLPAEPAEAVGLISYAVEDDPAQPTGVIGLQVRVRAPGTDPRSVHETADIIFDALQGAYRLTLPGGLVVGYCWREVSAPLGADESGRYQLTDSYYCQIEQTTTHRP